LPRWRLYQARSGHTHRVNGIEGTQLCIHAAFAKAMSGHLRFFWIIHTAWIDKVRILVREQLMLGASALLMHARPIRALRRVTFFRLGAPSAMP